MLPGHQVVVIFDVEAFAQTWGHLVYKAKDTFVFAAPDRLRLRFNAQKEHGVTDDFHSLLSAGFSFEQNIELIFGAAIGEVEAVADLVAIDLDYLVTAGDAITSGQPLRIQVSYF